MNGREKQIGLNEAVFREVNERLETIAQTLEIAPAQLDLVCECGDATCDRRISMTLEEYEQLRADPRQFAVYPGHAASEVETIVESRKGYDVVSKIEGAPERIAEETDPRR